MFAHRLGDYFGAQLGSTSPSPLLHFWSLAVEEQFYLCWPPLLVLLARRPRQYRRLVLATIAVLATASFVVGLWLTSSRPSWAFFLLPARMGELLAGAALAVVGTGIAAIPARVAGRARAGSGMLGIVVACFGFDETMPWPGAAVLVPVVATMAVIVAGTSTTIPWAPAAVLAVAAAAVDRPPLLRPVPLALAGARARRGGVGPAHLAAALRRDRSSPSAPRRCRCGSSRTRSATPATSPPCRGAAWPSAWRCAADGRRRVGPALLRRSASTAVSRRRRRSSPPPTDA